MKSLVSFSLPIRSIRVISRTCWTWLVDG